MTDDEIRELALNSGRSFVVATPTERQTTLYPSITTSQPGVGPGAVFFGREQQLWNN
ncbi:MAG: hypothetical protein ABSH47_27200 [Bryobacteraceae bacterium]|jgi:hypothetical protein